MGYIHMRINLDDVGRRRAMQYQFVPAHVWINLRMENFVSVSSTKVNAKYEYIC